MIRKNSCGISLFLALLAALSLLPVSALASDAVQSRAKKYSTETPNVIVSNDASVVISVKPDKTSCGRGESISAAVSLRNINGTTTGLTGAYVSELFVVMLTDSNYNPVPGVAVQTAGGLDAVCRFTFPASVNLPAGTYRITARKSVGSNVFFGEAAFLYKPEQTVEPEPTEQPEPAEQTELTEQTEPFIVTQPKNRTVAADSTVKFSVKADGEKLTYRWYVRKKGESGWTRISGATGEVLSFTAGKSMNGSLYRCEVSAEGGSTVTDAARLTVVSAPRIVTQPLSVCVREGKTVTFKVKAVGGGLKYQWYCQKPEDGRWQEITNSVQASFTVTAKMARNGYKYKCLVSNKAGSVWSKPVKLTVT